MNFDMHTHFIAPEFVEAISKPGSPWQAKLIKKGDQPWIEHDQGYSYPLTPGFHSTAARLADMACTKLDMAAVSVSPSTSNRRPLHSPHNHGTMIRWPS